MISSLSDNPVHLSRQKTLGLYCYPHNRSIFKYPSAVMFFHYSMLKFTEVYILVSNYREKTFCDKCVEHSKYENTPSKLQNEILKATYDKLKV